MDKIDRLGWADGISLKAFGVHVGIRVNEPDVLPRLHAILPPTWTPGGTIVERLYSLRVGKSSAANVRYFNLAYADARQIARDVNLDAVVQAIESDLHLHIAEAAKRRVFVHAGVVGWRGQAIVIPGPSFSGKTTLVREFIGAGATYYSDEYAVFDQRGLVHAFPRPLQIRVDASGRQEKWQPERWGGFTGKPPLPVGLVLVTEHKAGARWRHRELSPGAGALALLGNTVSVRRQPEKALDMARAVASRARIRGGVRGEASEVVSSVLETMGVGLQAI
jgi:hypothetical protein